jgi:hypothetical protein
VQLVFQQRSRNRNIAAINVVHQNAEEQERQRGRKWAKSRERSPMLAIKACGSLLPLSAVGQANSCASRIVMPLERVQTLQE